MWSKALHTTSYKTIASCCTSGAAAFVGIPAETGFPVAGAAAGKAAVASGLLVDSFEFAGKIPLP